MNKEEKMFLVGVGERGNMIKIRTKFSNNKHKIWEEELTVRWIDVFNESL